MSTVYPIQPPCFKESGWLNVTSFYGSRTDPVTGRPSAFHYGVDCTRMTEEGSSLAEITVIADGVVVETHDGETSNTNYSNARGNYVFVRHNSREVTVYQHLANGLPVTPGQVLQKGASVGFMGNTGKVTGAHLHFEVQIDGGTVDPLPYLLLEKTIIPEGGDEDLLYWIYLDKDLKQGALGEDVVKLQTVLCRLSKEFEQEVREYSFNSKGNPDGSYGPAMTRIVKKVQKMAGIPETGECDRDTRTVLNQSVPALIQSIDRAIGRS